MSFSPNILFINMYMHAACKVDDVKWKSGTKIHYNTTLNEQVSKQEARACFYKHGCDSEGLLPYEVYAMRLLAGQARMLALEPQMEGPYVPGVSQRHLLGRKCTFLTVPV